MNFCVVHRVVLSKRTLLVCCCCILYSFDNRGRGLELNFYPKISVLVNIQFPENSFFRHASKSDLSPLDQLISNFLPQINFRFLQG